MTALVLENLAALPVQAQSLRMFLARLALDALVSARAARTVPEWQMRQVRREIDSCSRLMRDGNATPERPKACRKSGRPAPASL
jgi:hypothetical protein